MKATAEVCEVEALSEGEELLAVLLSEEGIGRTEENRIEPRAEGVVDLPLSFGQRRLWFLDRLDPGNPSYNVAFALRLRGKVDVSALEASFRGLLARHEALRTRFLAIRGVPAVRVEPEASFSLSVVDHTPLTPERGREELRRLTDDEANRSFDLSAVPLLRATLVRQDPLHHVLLVTAHHIVCDAWSIGVMTREIGALYAGHVRAVAPALPPLEIQYPDFADWQQKWLQGERLEKLVAFWKQTLADPPPPVELPFDRPRSSAPTRRGATVPFDVDRETSSRLTSIFRRAGASLYAGLAAAFATLLHRYGGSEDVIIGSPYANRSFEEIEPLVGFFVNTLPLRISLSGQPTFAELLERVRRGAEAVFAHQDLPFEAIVEAVQPDRNLTQNPIFEIFFALQNAPIQPVVLADLDAEAEMVQKTCRFDLELYVWEEHGRLRGSICYPTDSFDAPTIERMCAHWVRLLDDIAGRPDARIADLDCMTAEERGRIVQWSTGPHIGDPGLRLHQLWDERVRETPDRVAFRSGEGQWTYRAFDALARRIAARLRDRNVRPDATVGILCERSVFMWASVMAVLKVGAAYVPLDVDHPAARSAFIARESGFGVLLTQRSLADRLPEYDGERIAVDELERDGSMARRGAPSIAVGRDALFCVLYTSGSTGTPKGVCLTHGLVEDTVRRYAEGPATDALQFAPLGFDVSLEEAFPAWCTGGSLTLVPSEMRHDVRALARLLAERRVERAIFPITWLKQLAEIPMVDGTYALVDVVATGEQLQITDAVRDWFARQPACALRNVYGPTEAQVITDYVLATRPREWPALPPIGRPLPNFSGYVLGPHLELLPQGVPGELWARNETAARGYMGQPDRTAERFLPSPFGPAGSRMYRTGDIVRSLTDGALEFRGRRDGQLKIRGLRVETGEIEANLLGHPSVRDALVLHQKDASGSIQLLAAITWKGSAPSAAELMAHLRAALPDYMVPPTVFVCERFPLNSNGKVDRARVLKDALRESELARRADHAPPETRMECIVADVWREVLGLEHVGKNDHFFALGGHSLSATQVASRLEERIEREVPVRLMLEFPRLAELALELETLAPAATLEDDRKTMDRAREEFVL